MSRNIDDLRRELRPTIRQLISDCRAKGVELTPYFTLRTPWEQARLWRMTRGKSVIGRRCEHLRAEGAGYIADVITSVGPQYPGPGIKGHVTHVVPGQSWHNWGEAVDFYLKDEDGDIDWSGKGPGYTTFGETAEELGLTWGGRWTSPFDPGHVQQPPMGVLDFFGDDWSELSDTLQRKFGDVENA